MAISPRIVNILVDIVKGGPPADLKQRVTTWQRLGLNGYGAQLVGSGNSHFNFQAIVFGPLVGVQSRMNLIQQAQGTIVTICDSWPLIYNNCLIVLVGPPQLTPDRTNGGARGAISLRGVIIA